MCFIIFLSLFLSFLLPVVELMKNDKKKMMKNDFKNDKQKMRKHEKTRGKLQFSIF